MHVLAIVLVLVFAVFLVFGTISLFLLGWCWERVRSLFQDWHFKVWLAVTRFFGALTVVVPRFVNQAASDSHWFWASIAAGAAWLVLEVAAVGVEVRTKESGKKLAEVERQALFRTKLLTTLRRLVKIKRERIVRYLRDRRQTRTIGDARKAMSPSIHIAQTLQEMAFFLGEPSEQALKQNFCVGLFVLRDDILEPLYFFGSSPKRVGEKPPVTSSSSRLFQGFLPVCALGNLS